MISLRNILKFTWHSYIRNGLTEREKQMPYANTYIWNLKITGSDEPRGRTGIKTQT